MDQLHSCKWTPTICCWQWYLIISLSLIHFLLNKYDLIIWNLFKKSIWPKICLIKAIKTWRANSGLTFWYPYVNFFPLIKNVNLWQFISILWKNVISIWQMKPSGQKHYIKLGNIQEKTIQIFNMVSTMMS